MHLNVVDFKKKKRAEDRAKESQNAKEKNYEDYAWKDLCEDSPKLKKLRVPELNKYLKHHGLDKHLKSTKNDKVQAVITTTAMKTTVTVKAALMRMKMMTLTLVIETR